MHFFYRIIWFTVYIIAIIGTLFMITDFTLTYKRSPTVTIPETRPFPIQNVDFPAVAICNVNRISQRAAIDLAQELYVFISLYCMRISRSINSI